MRPLPHHNYSIAPTRDREDLRHGRRITTLLGGLFVAAFFLLCFGIPARASAATYYVSNCGTIGNDSNNGTSTSTPWLTIAKVNSSSFLPGDSILFNKGCTWREQLTVPSSGSAGNPITFGAYGSATTTLPIISGANLVTSWTATTTSNPTSTWESFVQGNENEGGVTASDTFSLAFTSNNTAGNTIIVAVSQGSAGASSYSCSDSQGNTYSIATSALSSAVWAVDKIFYATNIKGGANTVTISGIYSYAQVAILEYAGLATSTPLDVTAAATSSTGTALNSGSATTTSAYDLIFGFGSTANPTLSAGTGFTVRQSDNYNFMPEDKTVTSNGSYNATASNSTSTAWIMQMAAFKELFTAATSSTLYYASVSARPNMVFMDGALLTPVTAKASLATGDWWWDSTNSYVWVYDNPSGHTMEASQRAIAIDASGAQYVTITNLHTTKANNYGSELGGYTTINEVTADYNDVNGINAWESSSTIANGIIVESSTVAYNGGSGFVYGHVNNMLIQGNNVHHNSWDPLQTSSRGLDGGAPDTTNVVVQYNNVHENGYGQTGSASAGITCDTCGSGIVFRYNESWGNNGRGISIDADNNVQAYYNLVRNNAVGGISVFADANTSMTGHQIYNNTLYGNSTFGILIEGPSAGSAPAGCTNNTITNNIVVGTVGGPNLEAFNGCENPGTDGLGNVYTYNDFGPDATNFIQWGASTYYSTLAAWQAASGQTNNLNANPLFVSTSTPNFALTSSSPAIDAGLNLGSTYQLALASSSTWPSGVVTLNQNSYGSGWDIGAYVYTQTSTPSVAMTAPAASSTVSGTVSVSASSSAVSPASIASVQFYLDGLALGSAVTSSPYSISWNTATASNATHTLYALATDNYSNTASSTSITVTVNNTPPSPGIVVVTGGGAGPPIPLASSTNTAPPITPTTGTPATSSSTQLLAALQAKLNTLLAQLAALQGASLRAVFSRDLALWDTGTDVRNLQLLLASQARGPAAARLNAHGATTVFGLLTYHALVEFQTYAGIQPASGYFGPKTRAFVNTHE